MGKTAGRFGVLGAVFMTVAVVASCGLNAQPEPPGVRVAAGGSGGGVPAGAGSGGSAGMDFSLGGSGGSSSTPGVGGGSYAVADGAVAPTNTDDASREQDADVGDDAEIESGADGAPIAEAGDG
jgi:hypothetical protein